MQKKSFWWVNFIFLRKKTDFQLFATPYYNTPGTAGGPGGRDRMLAVKSRKNAKKISFFRKKIKIT